jgi:ubiquinone/menaquinone biosynthesis C-methylase UbiE
LARTDFWILSLYNRYVLPRLINAAMRTEELRSFRERIIPEARGVVLEVGVGSGLNLPFYMAQVAEVRAVDPSHELLTMARSKVASLPFGVTFYEQSSHPLPFPDNSVDTAVITWSLCSIPDPSAALREVRRVLKPGGGTLLFVEHGLSPDRRVQTWQNRLTPAWRKLAGGCHLNRDVTGLISDAGFTITDLKTGYTAGPKFATYMYEGRAVVTSDPSTS